MIQEKVASLRDLTTGGAERYVKTCDTLNTTTKVRYVKTCDTLIFKVRNKKTWEWEDFTLSDPPGCKFPFNYKGIILKMNNGGYTNFFWSGVWHWKCITLDDPRCR